MAQFSKKLGPYLLKLAGIGCTFAIGMLAYIHFCGPTDLYMAMGYADEMDEKPTQEARTLKGLGLMMQLSPYSNRYTASWKYDDSSSCPCTEPLIVAYNRQKGILHDDTMSNRWKGGNLHHVRVEDIYTVMHQSGSYADLVKRVKSHMPARSVEPISQIAAPIVRQPRLKTSETADESTPSRGY